MSKRSESTADQPVEGALQALYGAAPDPAFVAALEQRLLAQARSMPVGQSRDANHKAHEEGTRSSSLLASFVSLVVQSSRRRWALGAIALVLALATALVAVGPQRVWAQVQRLLGYVPGVGFVDLDQARVLAAPVSLTREGVTLYVEQVIARPNGTTVALRAAGLPPSAQVWPQGARQEPGGEPKLRLPDGRLLAHRRVEYRYGAGTVEFPPLPAGAERVALVLPRLPLVPAGAAPEGWEVPLVLQPAGGDLTAALFPQPYRPERASDSHEGVTLRVLAVAQSAEETALRVAMEWQDPERYPFATMNSAYLRDDLGHVYSVATRPGNGSFIETEVIAIDPTAPPPTPAPASREETVAFGPVSPQARELTLLVEQVDMRVPAAAAFSIDLGENPQVGDSWPLDIDLEVAGVPLRVTGARIVEEAVGAPGMPERRTALAFDIVAGLGQGNRALTGLSLDGGAAGFTGAGGSFSPMIGRGQAYLYLAESAPLPHGRVEVSISSAIVTLRGPWELSWEVVRGE